ncbi:hypothetical protein BLNAU_15059 [Blattamonas nauphoetae]|uniref:Calcineurin-like phosphoesterase domain-containing protein n=1 Tax=Blattamonas nauphoetae TaxID=2049346 RepID=A0ABQ9XF37_9EUKA|nr:hypothetical protein BLNAU_15059 [Blattamonas nauphoetae]
MLGCCIWTTIVLSMTGGIVLGVTRTVRNQSPQLQPIMNHSFIKPGAVLADQATGTGIFMHITDMHIGGHYTTPEQWEAFVDTVVDKLVKPTTVLVTGDLVEGMKAFRTVPDELEFQKYYETIQARGWDNCDSWLDIRGNHDSPGLLKQFAENDHFTKYSSCGPLKKLVHSHTITLPPDDLLISVDKPLTYSFVLVDTNLLPSLIQPLSFFGTLPSYDNIVGTPTNTTKLLFDELHSPAVSSSTGTFLATHSPLFTTNEPGRSILSDLLERPNPDTAPILSLLCGHYHASHADRTFYTRTPSGRKERVSRELLAAAFGQQRAYRIFTLDHGMVQFKEYTWGTTRAYALSQGMGQGLLSDPPQTFTGSVSALANNLAVYFKHTQPPSNELDGEDKSRNPLVFVQITNPPPSDQITARTHWGLVQNSTHIRAIIHSDSAVSKVWVDVYEGAAFRTDQLARMSKPPLRSFNLSLTTQPNPNNIPLFVARWDPKEFSKHAFYTFYTHVVVDVTPTSDEQPLPAAQNAAEKELVFAGHTFSYSGRTLNFPLSVQRIIINLPADKLIKMGLLVFSILPIIAFLLSFTVPLFAQLLQRSRLNTLRHTPHHSAAVRLRSSKEIIREVVMYPSRLTLPEDDSDSKGFSACVRCCSVTWAFTCIPKSFSICCCACSQRIARFERQVFQFSQSRHSHRIGFTTINGTVEDDSKRELQPLTVRPADDLLTPPPTSCKERFLVYLIRKLYPSYYLPPVCTLIVVLAIVVFHFVPLLSAPDEGPIRSFRAGVWTASQGGTSVTRVDTVAVLALILVPAAILPHFSLIANYPPFFPTKCSSSSRFRRALQSFFVGDPTLPHPTHTRTQTHPILSVLSLIVFYTFQIFWTILASKFTPAFSWSICCFPLLITGVAIQIVCIVSFCISTRKTNDFHQS